MTKDILSFGMFLVTATPGLTHRVRAEVHDHDLGQRIVRRVVSRAWQYRHGRPSGPDLMPWLLGLLDQEKELEILKACPQASSPQASSKADSSKNYYRLERSSSAV